MNNIGDVQIFATTAGRPLAELICHNRTPELGKAQVRRFNDGEVDVKIIDNVRARDVYIIAPTHPPAENLLEAIWLCDAARLSSAGRITFVIPYMGYARSDRKSESRMPVGSRLTFDMLEVARPDRLIVLDIHAEQSLACVRNAIPDHLYGSAVLVPQLQKILKKHNFVVASPDKGGAARAGLYAKHLGQSDFVFFSKIRPRAGEVDNASIKIIGDVAGKVVVMVDDMIDTGGTVIANAEKAKEAGATKVIVCATHGIFSNNALEAIEKSQIDEVYVTDSIYHDPKAMRRKSRKVHVVSVSGLLAQAIYRTNQGSSLSELIL